MGLNIMFTPIPGAAEEPVGLVVGMECLRGNFSSVLWEGLIARATRRDFFLQKVAESDKEKAGQDPA
jgi:hypothetical protein